MNSKSKSRLDLLVVSRGLATSRHQAQGLILAGRVLVDDVPVDKPGAQISEHSAIRLKGQISQFVGRGGEKLAGALDYFGIQVAGQVGLDVGASTGGFTDCMLQRGAVKVYAVDVGYNQLAHQLRIDPRVVVMERVNARELQVNQFSELPLVVTMDLSFIGLSKVLPAVLRVCAPGAVLVLLVKPQFELGPESVAKGGVVRDAAVGRSAVDGVETFLREQGVRILGVQASVLKGYKKGNQEYFLCAQLAEPLK